MCRSARGHMMVRGQTCDIFSFHLCMGPGNQTQTASCAAMPSPAAPSHWPSISWFSDRTMEPTLSSNFWSFCLSQVSRRCSAGSHSVPWLLYPLAWLTFSSQGPWRFVVKLHSLSSSPQTRPI